VINQRWRPYVVADDAIDRRFYELCALTELKNRLRSGDIWVTGSRQFKDFDAYLLESSRFAELRAQQSLSLRSSTMAICDKSSFAGRGPSWLRTQVRVLRHPPRKG
jgi:hypothetical protein